MHTSMTGSKSRLENVVCTQTGRVRGQLRDANGVSAFKGIPYAAPPVGGLRWRAPASPSPWNDVLDATTFGSACLSALQNDRRPGPRSEECLTLNVWTAAKESSERRPVMVWVHGGGFQFGSSANPAMDGSFLAAKGVVVVSFNYRLGIFGFFAHPDLDVEAPSGNYGLLDQLSVLRWVQTNIAAFGGDPENVTLFGESAGAMAVGILMASPLAQGLFHKAIGQSGAFWDGRFGPLQNFEEARARGLAFARQVGNLSIAELRDMPSIQLNAAALWNFEQDHVMEAFSPSIDGCVITDFPARRFQRGEQMSIPLLAGWNSAEEYPFMSLSLPANSAHAFRAAAEAIFGIEHLRDFLNHYPAETDLQTMGSAAALTGDMVVGEQCWQWLRLHRESTRAPVYGYHFNYTSPYTPIASHVTDVPFVFGTLTPQGVLGSSALPAEEDHALSQVMMSYWVNFARQGNPNGCELPFWPPHDESDMIQILGKAIGPCRNPQAARFHFLGGFRQDGVLPTHWRPRQAPGKGPP